MLRLRFGIVAIFLSGLLFLACTGAEPNASDVKRVKKDYLSLRFQRPFTAALKELRDADLMALSCQKNQVNCQKTLELLKKEDPNFYKKFQELKAKQSDG